MNEMAELSGFEEQMRSAVTTVLAMLPNKGADREAVIEIALEAVLNGNIDAASDDVRKLVAACPECYGVPRKKVWWQIVQKYLSPDEVLRVYFVRFPTEITVRQQNSLIEYLIKQGYKDEAVRQAFADRGFFIRQNSMCRSNNASRHYGTFT